MTGEPTSATLPSQTGLSGLCQAITEHAPLPMATVEGATHIVRYANPAFCRLMGASKEQLIGQRLPDMLPEKDECLLLLDRVFRTGQPESHTEQEHTKTDPVFWSYTGWPLETDERFVGVMIQVTETAQIHGATVAMNEALLLGSLRQHELTEAAERLNVQLQVEIAARQKTAQELSEKARLIDLSNDAIIVQDLDGKIRLWNKGAEKLFGWTFSEVVGNELHTFLQTKFPKPKEEIMVQLRREGRFNGEVVQTVSDGRQVRSLCGWVLDPDTASIFTSYTDITERRKAEDELRRSDERYRNLFDSMDEGFCILEMLFDASGKADDYRFVEVNPSFEKQSRITGATGKRMREIALNHEAYWFEIFGAVAQTGQAVRFVNEAKSLNSWFDVYAFRIGDGESRKVAVLFRNITERMVSEESLRVAHEQLADRAGHLENAVTERTAELTASNEQLEAVVYSIAHDLRAPLRAMQGFSSLLLEEEGAALSDTGRDYARRIGRSAQFMDALLLDLLVFSRISQQRLEFPVVHLESILRTEVSRLEKEMLQAGADIEISGPCPPVLAHEPTLRQVVYNLVSNSLKFVRPGARPKIRLSAEARDGFVRVWVEDNGIGIEPAYQDEVFRLFTRLQGDDFPGTGIGLAIVEKGIKRMGGRVGVESAPNMGSRFWFDLIPAPVV